MSQIINFLLASVTIAVMVSIAVSVFIPLVDAPTTSPITVRNTLIPFSE